MSPLSSNRTAETSTQMRAPNNKFKFSSEYSVNFPRPQRGKQGVNTAVNAPPRPGALREVAALVYP